LDLLYRDDVEARFDLLALLQHDSMEQRRNFLRVDVGRSIASLPTTMDPTSIPWSEAERLQTAIHGTMVTVSTAER